MSRLDEKWRHIEGLFPENREGFVDAAISRIRAFESRNYVYVDDAGGPETIEVGDRLSWYEAGYQHQARVVITKINRRSIVAYEVEKSYKPGARWTLHKNWNGWKNVRHDGSFDSLNIPDGVRIY